MKKRLLDHIVDTIANFTGISIESEELVEKNKQILLTAFILGSLASFTSFVLGLTTGLVFFLRLSAAPLIQLGILNPILSLVSLLISLGFSLKNLRKIIKKTDITHTQKIKLLSFEILKIIAMTTAIGLTLALLIHPLTGTALLSALIAVLSTLFVINFFKIHFEKSIKLQHRGRSLEKLDLKTSVDREANRAQKKDFDINPKKDAFNKKMMMFSNQTKTKKTAVHQKNTCSAPDHMKDTNHSIYIVRKS